MFEGRWKGIPWEDTREYLRGRNIISREMFEEYDDGRESDYESYEDYLKENSLMREDQLREVYGSSFDYETYAINRIAELGGFASEDLYDQYRDLYHRFETYDDYVDYWPLGREGYKRAVVEGRYFTRYYYNYEEYIDNVSKDWGQLNEKEFNDMKQEFDGCRDYASYIKLTTTKMIKLINNIKYR